MKIRRGVATPGVLRLLREPWASCVFLFTILLVAVVALPFAAFSAEKTIAIKVAQYPSNIDLTCPQGAVWRLGDRSGEIRGTDSVQVVGALASKALVRYHVIVDTIPVADSSKVSATKCLWGASGWPVGELTVGERLYHPETGVLLCDVRSVLISIGSFDNLQDAQNTVDNLSASAFPAKIQEEAVLLSQGKITLKVGSQVEAVGQELVIEPSGLIRLKKVEYAAGYPWHGFEDRDYRGPITFRWGAHDAVDCIQTSGLERVLAGVVPSEISAKAQIGALQAQAVAARGMILAGIGQRHIGEGFDTCSEQHCQVYAGETSVTPDIAKKIAPTWGFVLGTAQGGIVPAFYSSNCGGHGEANHLVWGPPAIPVLAGVWDAVQPPDLDLSEEEQAGVFIRTPPESFCGDKTVEGGDKFRWTKTFSAADWKTVQDKIGVGRIRKVTDIARGFSGRIYQLTFVGEAGSKTVKKELAIRQLLGSLKSSCFVAEWKLDSAGFIAGGTLTGAGFGHGVGMCQTGAQSLAKRGWSFDRILLHYYPGSSLKQWY